MSRDDFAQWWSFYHQRHTDSTYQFVVRHMYSTGTAQQSAKAMQMIEGLWRINQARKDMTRKMYVRATERVGSVLAILDAIHATMGYRSEDVSGVCCISGDELEHLKRLTLDNGESYVVRSDIAEVLDCYYIMYHYDKYTHARISTQARVDEDAEYKRFQFMSGVLRLTI